MIDQGERMEAAERLSERLREAHDTGLILYGAALDADVALSGTGDFHADFHPCSTGCPLFLHGCPARGSRASGHAARAGEHACVILDYRKKASREISAKTKGSPLT
jgi:hypothetical protein